MNRLNKTEFAVFLNCKFSLFLKDPFFPDYLELIDIVSSDFATFLASYFIILPN